MAASDEARRYLNKAIEDEYVVNRLLEDAAAPDSMVGFHAQQAAEKLLKAALFLAEVAPPRTHNLAELLDLAATHCGDLPPNSEDLRWLTPYAVLYRYEGEADEDAAPVSLHDARERIQCLRVWVEKLLKSKEDSAH